MLLSYLEGSSLSVHYRRRSALIIFMLLPCGYVPCTVALSLLYWSKKKQKNAANAGIRKPWGRFWFFCFHFEAHTTCVSIVIVLLCFSEQTHTFLLALKTLFPVCWPYITDKGWGQNSIVCSHPTLTSSHLSSVCLILLFVFRFVQSCWIYLKCSLTNDTLGNKHIIKLKLKEKQENLIEPFAWCLQVTALSTLGFMSLWAGGHTDVTVTTDTDTGRGPRRGTPQLKMEENPPHTVRSKTNKSTMMGHFMLLIIGWFCLFILI